MKHSVVLQASVRIPATVEICVDFDEGSGTAEIVGAATVLDHAEIVHPRDLREQFGEENLDSIAFAELIRRGKIRVPTETFLLSMEMQQVHVQIDVSQDEQSIRREFIADQLGLEIAGDQVVAEARGAIGVGRVRKLYEKKI